MKKLLDILRKVINRVLTMDVNHSFVQMSTNIPIMELLDLKFESYFFIYVLIEMPSIFIKKQIDDYFPYKFVKGGVIINFITMTNYSYMFKYSGDVRNIIKFIADNIISKYFNNSSESNIMCIINQHFIMMIVEYESNGMTKYFDIGGNIKVIQERYDLYIKNSRKHVTEFDGCIESAMHIHPV